MTNYIKKVYESFKKLLNKDMPRSKYAHIDDLNAINSEDIITPMATEVVGKTATQ